MPRVDRLDLGETHEAILRAERRELADGLEVVRRVLALRMWKLKKSRSRVCVAGRARKSEGREVDVPAGISAVLISTLCRESIFMAYGITALDNLSDGYVPLRQWRESRLLTARQPTDNAFVESFNGTFWAECLDTH